MTSLAVLPLLETLRDHANDPDLLELLEPHATERSWLRLQSTPELELWLISWPPGARTHWHDHGTSSGAFTVLAGSLVEHSWEGALRLFELAPGGARAFAPGHVHDVRNATDEPALSLHAYSPRLTTMSRFKFLGDRLQVLGVEKAGKGRRSRRRTTRA